MDGGQNGAMSRELVIVFEDAVTESPMGESPHSTSETFTFCPQAFCACAVQYAFVCECMVLLSSVSLKVLMVYVGSVEDLKLNGSGANTL